MLCQQLLDVSSGPRSFRSPGFLYGGMRLGMRLIRLRFTRLFLVNKGDDPIIGLIAPDVSFSVAPA